MFEQFKENLSLAREFTGTVRDGLRSAQAAWRKATPDKWAIWLLVPAVIVVNALADHFSAPWYYEVAVLVLAVVLVGLGSGGAALCGASSNNEPVTLVVSKSR